MNGTFFAETIKILEYNGKKLEDLKFGILSNNNQYLNKTEDDTGYFTISDFIANSNFVYDDGYGGNEINMSIKLIGKDFWLERHEYDGSEWWEYKSMPKKPKNHLKTINFKVE